MNAMTVEMKEEITAALKVAAADKEARVVVITGAGRAFCAGADYTMLGQLTPTFLLDDLERTNEMVNAVINLPKPAIAAVNGAAIAPGYSLLLGCDIIIASEKARFGATWVLLGLHPMGGLTYLLTRRVGFAKASELLLTGRMVDGIEAEKIGLPNKVVPPEQLESATIDFARTLAKGAPLSQSFIKSSLSRVQTVDLATMMEHERRTDAVLAFTDDSKEALAAFSQKRPPVFKWR